MIDDRIALSLDNMKRAVEEAISFAADVTEADFLASSQLQKACAMCLVIVRESAARVEQVSPDFVAAHADWPWKDIRVWLTVKNSLPDLLPKIEAIGELDPRLWPKD